MDALAVTLLILGCLLLLAGGIWFLVEAFREHVGWGVLCFLVPPVQLIFLCLHWVRVRASVGLQILGLIVVIGAAFVSPAMRHAVAQSLPKEYALASGLEKEKPRDLTAEIQSKREAVEQLEAKLAQDGAALNVEYQALAKKKTALKANDAASVTAFNAEVAVYQQKATILKTLKQQADAARQELTTLLDERARQSVNPANPKSSVLPASAGSKKVVMYSTSHCPACAMAKSYFAKKGIPYDERDVEHSPQAREEFEKMGGRGVPLILVGSEKMEGFSEQRLNQLL